MLNQIPPEAAVTGAAGSAIALRWFPGGWVAKIVTFLSGCGTAIGGALFFNWYAGLTSVVGLAFVSFGCGLFGVLVMDKVMELVRAINVAEIWQAVIVWIRKRLGVQ